MSRFIVCNVWRWRETSTHTRYGYTKTNSQHSTLFAFKNTGAHTYTRSCSHTYWLEWQQKQPQLTKCLRMKNFVRLGDACWGATAAWGEQKPQHNRPHWNLYSHLLAIIHFCYIHKFVITLPSHWEKEWETEEFFLFFGKQEHKPPTTNRISVSASVVNYASTTWTCYCHFMLLHSNNGCNGGRNT